MQVTKQRGKRQILAQTVGIIVALWLSGHGWACAQLWMKGGHSAIVWQTVFSTDRRFLLSASGDNTIKVWNADTNSPRFGQLVASVRAHVSGVVSIAESNGLVVSAGGGSDNQIKLWRLQTNGRLNFVRSWRTPLYGVYSVAFVNWLSYGSPKRLIAAGSKGGFLLADPDSNTSLWYPFPWMPGEPLTAVLTIAPAESRNEFSIGTEKGSVYSVYLVRPQSQREPIHYPDVLLLFNYGSRVRAISYDTTNDFLLIGGDSGQLVGWRIVGTPAQVFSVPFSNASGGTGWIHTIHAYRWTSDPAFRQYFVVAGWTWNNGGGRPTLITYSWDTVSNQPPSKCGETVLTDRTGTFLKGSLASINAPYNPYLYAVGSEYRSIEWWQPMGACISDWTMLPSPTIYQSAVRSVAISHDDQLVASGSDQVVHVWDIGGNLVFTRPVSGPLRSVRFSPVERRLIIADNTMLYCLVWTGSTFIISWTSFISLRGGIAFSPTGQRLLAASLSTWYVYNALNGHIIASGTEKVNNVPIPILCCAWAPDDRYFAVGRRDGKIRLYNTTNYTLYRELRVGNYMNPTALAFAVINGRLKLFVGTSTGVLQQWDVVNGSLDWSQPIHSEWISALCVQGDWMVSASTEVPTALKYWIDWMPAGAISQETGTGVRDAFLSFQTYRCGIDEICRYLAYGRQDATLVLTRIGYIPLFLIGGRTTDQQEVDGGERE
ncbi:hypothetical protein HRbin15_02115 [bacterium HR15]|nr:hypothetical protein HRbin15_02115 [bacterium HR15]